MRLHYASESIDAIFQHHPKLEECLTSDYDDKVVSRVHL